jgi:hypothetical protein
MQVTISIINYNYGRYLKQAIDSNGYTGEAAWSEVY